MNKFKKMQHITASYVYFKAREYIEAFLLPKFTYVLITTLQI